MQNNPLKPELVQMLNLEHHGYTHPEAVLVALEAAQADLARAAGLVPGPIFSIGNIILQSLHTSNTNINLSPDDKDLFINELLQYEKSVRFPDRIVHANFSSGDKMVETATYQDCSLEMGSFTVPKFSRSTLYLGHHNLLSVVFVHIH